MNTFSRHEPGIAEQAARWLGVLERGGRREHAEFAAWLRASPQHVREFLLLTAMEKAVDELDLGDIDVEQVLRGAAGNVVRLDDESKQEPATSSTRSWNRQGAIKRWAAAAMVAAVLATGGLWLALDAGQTYETAVGEQRNFELEDGSTVELSPRSRIHVRMSADARDIELESGEALFTVERDPRRAFRVQSGDAIVRAVGTQFAVLRRANSTTVSVLEGRVEVTRDKQPLPLPSPILGAGEEIKLTAGESVVTHRIVDAGQTKALPQRSLTFSGDALSDIAEDFNRYNRSPQILIEGEALRARQFSGVFNVDDPSSLIDYLAQDERLTFERSNDVIVVKAR